MEIEKTLTSSGEKTLEQTTQELAFQELTDDETCDLLDYASKYLLGSWGTKPKLEPEVIKPSPMVFDIHVEIRENWPNGTITCNHSMAISLKTLFDYWNERFDSKTIDGHNEKDAAITRKTRP